MTDVSRVDNSEGQTKTLTLDIFRGDALSGARRWADLHPSERRRRAIIACQSFDAAELWGLTEAHTLLYGGAGGGMSPQTARAYRNGLNKFLQYAQSQAVNLLSPSQDMGPLYTRTLETSGLKPSSIRSALAAARAFFRALRWAGATQLDPFSDTKPAADKVAAWDKRSPYSENEVQTLLEAAPPRDRLLILLCAHGGLRVSEALALKWADIEGEALTVQHGKGGKQRRVMLSTTLHAALNEYRTSEGGSPEGAVIGGTDTAARARLNVIAQRAGIKSKGFHAFRHYAGTRLAGKLSLEDAARHLGHSSIETTRVYAKWADTALGDELKGW